MSASPMQIVRLLLASSLSFLLIQPVFAYTFEIEGRAPLALGSVETVRRVAIRDALEQAASAEGVRYRALSVSLNNGNTLESAQWRTAVTNSPAEVLREWQDAEFLHVLVRGETPSSCKNKNAKMSAGYKKKVVITRFDIPHIVDVSDMPDIWVGLSADLEERLRSTQKFRTEVSPLIGHPLIKEAPQNLSREDALWTSSTQVRDAQFIVLGQLVDSHTEEARWPWQSDRRRFEIEARILDGLTGSEIARHRLHGEARGRVNMSGRPFGSQSFFKSAYGEAVEKVLTTLAAEIEDELDCIPFSSPIERVENQRVYFNAGRLAGIRPGDVFALYQQERQFPRQGVAAARIKGIPEHPVGSVRVLSVQPQFAVAEIIEEATAIDAREGDLIRFE